MFVHLHCHFTGSYSDSILRIAPAIEKIQRLGQPALALTDHGEIPFAWPFQDACLTKHLKPLFGAELYFVENAQESIEKNDKERFHLVAIAKNATGLRNLFCLLSDAWLENSFEDKRGLVDWRLLEKYGEGLVLLSGCFYNCIGQTFYRRGKEAASAVVSRFRDIFSDDFYIEVARHHVAEEEKIVAGLIKIAGWHGLTPVLTNDVHYQEPADWLAQEVLMRTRYDHVMEFKAHSKEYWLKSEEEMRALGMPDAYIEQSAAIADTCGDLRLPVISADARSPLPDVSAIATLINDGKAAYLGKMKYIDTANALRHAREVLGEENTDVENVAAALAGLPRSSEPDSGSIVYAFGKPIKEIIPLKRAAGKIMTQWDRTSCEKAGAIILPATHSPLFEKRKSFFKI